MKSVMISIQPKRVEKIAKGEKTIEVRKTSPKIETPFKCYIYETKGKKVKQCDGCDVTYYGRGKIIGDFVCDYIKEYVSNECGWYIYDLETCLLCDEIASYGKGKPIYGWHISDLKIYDKPKELSEFFTPMGKRPSYMVEIPPKSWFYIEER